MIRLRRFFLPLPLPLPSTTASCLIQILELTFTCGYARNLGIVPQNFGFLSSIALISG